jgi:hypothetical protein
MSSYKSVAVVGAGRLGTLILSALASCCHKEDFGHPPFASWGCVNDATPILTLVG